MRRDRLPPSAKPIRNGPHEARVHMSDRRERYMNTEIRQLLEDVKQGRVSVEDALLKIKTAPFEDIGYAKVDL